MAEGQRVCSVEKAGSLEHWLRRVLQNPKGIARKYALPGMRVLDFGCGSGIFSIEMAKAVGPNGKVVAADLQQAMLDWLRRKIKGTGLDERIVLHRTTAKTSGLKEKFDFVLAFYVAHETPDLKAFLKEMRSLLKGGGRLLVVEPSFHVSREDFKEMFGLAQCIGLKAVEQPKVFLSRAVLFEAG